MSDGPTPTEMDRFDYFMVRLHRTTGDPDRLSGQVERLGTGERWKFDTGEQLVRLVGGETTSAQGRDPCGDPTRPERPDVC